jgi:hypothetical protein
MLARRCAGDEPHTLDDIDRLTTTRFVRRKYRSTWPAD